MRYLAIERGSSWFENFKLAVIPHKSLQNQYLYFTTFTANLPLLSSKFPKTPLLPFAASTHKRISPHLFPQWKTRARTPAGASATSRRRRGGAWGGSSTRITRTAAERLTPICIRSSSAKSALKSRSSIPPSLPPRKVDNPPKMHSASSPSSRRTVREEKSELKWKLNS